MPTPIRFKGIVGTTAQIATDRFAGRIAFDSTLNRFVVFYDATNYAINARRDVLETFTLGLQDSTLTAGLPMFADTSGRLATEAVASFRARIGAAATADLASYQPIDSDLTAIAALTTTAFGRSILTQADAAATRTTIAAYGSGDNASFGTLAVSGTANFSGAVQTTGVQRISAAGAASFTTLSTTGLATLASATVSDLTSGRITRATTAGRLTDDAGLSTTQSGGATDSVIIGSVATSNCRLRLNCTSSVGRYIEIQEGSSPRWYIGGSPAGTTTPLKIIACDNAGSVIDDVLFCERASASAIILGGTTLRPVNFTGAIQTAGAISKVISSTTETVSGNVYNQYTTVTQTGIVTQQSLAGTGAGSRTIGAGRLNTQGAGMLIYLCGTYTTDGSAGSATIRIRIGSTTYRTIGSFTLDNNVTDGIWYIRGRITTRTTGATGTVGGQLVWEHQSSAVAGAEVMHVQGATSIADVTVDLTASQAIDVDWTATDAGTILTCSCFSIDLIR